MYTCVRVIRTKVRTARAADSPSPIHDVRLRMELDQPHGLQVS